MYSLGWNKKLSYCTAFSIDEAVDVTKRYTRHWPQTLERRNKVTEAQLALVKKKIQDLFTLFSNPMLVFKRAHG